MYKDGVSARYQLLNLGNPQKAQAQGGCRHYLLTWEKPRAQGGGDGQQGSPHACELLLETPAAAAGKEGGAAFLLILNFV